MTQPPLPKRRASVAASLLRLDRARQGFLPAVSDLEPIEDAAHLEGAADDRGGAHLQPKVLRLFPGAPVRDEHVAKERRVDEVGLADVDDHELVQLDQIGQLLLELLGGASVLIAVHRDDACPGAGVRDLYGLLDHRLALLRVTYG